MSLDTIERDLRTKALNERDKWEIEKIKEEIEQMRRPRGRIVSAIGTGFAAVVTLLGAGFTYQLNSLRAENAALTKSSIELQNEKLKAETQELQVSKTQLAMEIDALQKDEQQVKERLNGAKKELDDVQAALQAAAPTAPAPVAEAITRAQSSVQILQRENDRSREAQDQRAKRLGEIKGRILAPNNLRVAP